MAAAERGRAVRKSLRKETAAATHIQSTYRGFEERKETAHLVHSLDAPVASHLSSSESSFYANNAVSLAQGPGEEPALLTLSVCPQLKPSLSTLNSTPCLFALNSNSLCLQVRALQCQPTGARAVTA